MSEETKEAEVKDYHFFESITLEEPESPVSYEIAMPGVTLLTGEDGIGKTTVCKSIYEYTANAKVPAFKATHVTMLDARLLECYSMRPGSLYTNNAAGNRALRRMRAVSLAAYDEVSETGVEVVEAIESTIRGRMFYDEDSQKFFFKPSGKGKLRVPAENLPSGVRTLGVIQMIAAKFYDKPTRPPILIIDDLEATLHPAWQIVYANLLFKFAVKGVRVLSTAHGVYTLNAALHVMRLHEEGGNRPRVHYRAYVGRAIGDRSEFFDVSDDANALIEPYSLLMRKFL